MTRRNEDDQVELDYIRLQYELADALQESNEAPAPYAYVAQQRYGRVRAASQAALRRLSGLLAQRGVRATPAR